MSRTFRVLTESARHCQICAGYFTHTPKPVFQLSQSARVLIAGQAPGIRAHRSGVAFNDPSGDRLRAWMGVSMEAFYNADKIAILPMGFCYPGKGRSGDLPPRPECAETWRQQILDGMPEIRLTLVIGRYAMQWHLGESGKRNLTETVRAYQSYAPDIIPLPHPSPRNNLWLRKNDWFETELLPFLRARIRTCLDMA